MTPKLPILKGAVPSSDVVHPLRLHIAALQPKRSRVRHRLHIQTGRRRVMLSTIHHLILRLEGSGQEGGECFVVPPSGYLLTKIQTAPFYKRSMSIHEEHEWKQGDMLDSEQHRPTVVSL